MNKIIFPLVAALAAVIMLTGCGREEGATDNPLLTLTDDLGRNVTFSQLPQRVVVTSASFLEPMEAVGAEKLVVGRPDSKMGLPDFAKALPGVGKVYQIDTEKVAACEPDLVIINQGMNEKLIPTLEAAGIKTLVLDTKSYESVKHNLKLFAALTGEESRGETFAALMDDDIAAVKKRLPPEKLRVSIIHSTSQGLTVQLEGSIAGTVAKMLGWENVAEGTKPLENNPTAAPYSLETLVAQNPEVIFITSMGDLQAIKSSMERTVAEPAWQTIPAVKEGRIYYLPQELFLLSPGLKYPEAVETMAKCVYPDLF